MGQCRHCRTEIPGRRRICDKCKSAGGSRPNTAPAKKTAAKRPAKPKITYPPGLGTRGRHLWKALGHDADTPAGVLAVEACRLADRLEHLDQYLTGGDPWLDLVEQIEGSGRYQIVVDRALAEARQQQTTFKGLLSELGATRVKGHGGYGGEQGAPPATPPQSPAPGNPMDEVTKRRQRREQGA